MKFVAIDIETTGLDPAVNQIIEFAAVACDTDTGVRREYSRFCNAESAYWQAAAYKMHEPWLEKFTKSPYKVGSLWHDFRVWLSSAYSQQPSWLYAERVTVAGKNFAGFDLRFIERLPGYTPGVFHHRCIDPAGWFIKADDKDMPALYKCAARAGLNPGTKEQHTALHDANLVADLVCKAFTEARTVRYKDDPKPYAGILSQAEYLGYFNSTRGK